VVPPMAPQPRPGRPGRRLSPRCGSLFSSSNTSRSATLRLFYFISDLILEIKFLDLISHFHLKETRD
jgi:hypothetical protein